jgi:hypothetical protein
MRPRGHHHHGRLQGGRYRTGQELLTGIGVRLDRPGPFEQHALERL